MHIGLAMMLGAVVGLVYCLMLWRSLTSLLEARRPGARVLAGAVVRVALAVLALFLIGGSQWQSLVAALAGFALARGIVSNRASHRLNGPVRASRS